jgi:hypothetical protein
MQVDIITPSRRMTFAAAKSLCAASAVPTPHSIYKIVVRKFARQLGEDLMRIR